MRTFERTERRDRVGNETHTERTGKATDPEPPEDPESAPEGERWTLSRTFFLRRSSYLACSAFSASVLASALPMVKGAGATLTYGRTRTAMPLERRSFGSHQTEEKWRRRNCVPSATATGPVQALYLFREAEAERRRRRSGGGGGAEGQGLHLQEGPSHNHNVSQAEKSQSHLQQLQREYQYIP